MTTESKPKNELQFPEREGHLYFVGTFMDKREYTERKVTGDPDDLRNHLSLRMRTKYSDEPYTEEHIGAIIADALETVGVKAPEGFDPDLYETYAWPLDLKIAVMEAATTGWSPENRCDPSEWHGYGNDAETLFQDHPELRDIFDKPAEQVALEWEARVNG